MKRKYSHTFFGAGLLAFMITPAAAIDGYTPITEAAAVQKVLSDAGFVQKRTVFSYYRGDGIMAEINTDYDFTTVRHWKVGDDGKLCFYVLKKPDHLIDCVVLHRSNSDANAYYVTWPEGSGYPVLPANSVPQKLHDELGKVAVSN